MEIKQKEFIKGKKYKTEKQTDFYKVESDISFKVIVPMMLVLLIVFLWVSIKRKGVVK